MDFGVKGAYICIWKCTNSVVNTVISYLNSNRSIVLSSYNQYNSSNTIYQNVSVTLLHVGTKSHIELKVALFTENKVP